MLLNAVIIEVMQQGIDNVECNNYVIPFLFLSSELITNVSEHCSQVIVEGNALIMLYEYISTSNRSRATLEMVKVCLLILLNVIKVKSHYYCCMFCPQNLNVFRHSQNALS